VSWTAHTIDVRLNPVCCEAVRYRCLDFSPMRLDRPLDVCSCRRVGDNSYAVEWMTYPLTRQHCRLVFIALGPSAGIETWRPFRLTKTVPSHSRVPPRLPTSFPIRCLS